MIIDFLLLLIVLIILIASAVFDKQHRSIPRALNIIVFVIAALGLIYQYVQYELLYWIPSAIAITVWFVFHAVNIILVKSGHKRIVGGADLNVYLCVSLCIPTLCNLWTSVWLIPLTIIFLGVGRLSTKMDTECKEKGNPMLYFMLIGFLFMLVFNCLLYGFSFL